MHYILQTTMLYYLSNRPQISTKHHSFLITRQASAAACAVEMLRPVLFSSRFQSHIGKFLASPCLCLNLGVKGHIHINTAILVTYPASIGVEAMDVITHTHGLLIIFNVITAPYYPIPVEICCGIHAIFGLTKVEKEGDLVNPFHQSSCQA